MPVASWIEDAFSAQRSSELTVIVTETSEANLRWAHNSLTTNGQMHDRTATVIAYDVTGDEAATAVVSGPLPFREALLDLVARATDGLAKAPREQPGTLPAGRADAGFAAPHPAEQAGIEVLAGIAADLGVAFGAARESQAFFGFAEHRLTTTWLATSTGTRRRHVQPAGRFELNVKDSATGGSAWVGAATRDFTDVRVGSLVAEALRRLEWSRRRISLPPGRYETLLPPSAVADLMLDAYWAMNGRDADEGRNVYAGPRTGSNRIGERLAVLPVTMASDPHEPGMELADFAVVPASSDGMVSVWDNGAPVDRVEWIRGGTLERLVRTRAGHRASGETTPWAFPSENLVIDTGSEDTLADMIAATERGLLLTCLWYIREVDPETLLLTGLTRDGVYLIEDGEVVAEVNNFRFNESPIGLLRRATQASVAERTLCREWNDYFLWTVAPALRIPDFNMSTVSQAT
ncbi:metallopeptidase TldD-related protein [Propionicicella superfundia]|uniref:metallopeptidase TldD-related protein n=1 Tax=Propionicicella superfundia TaxID=348582 RepID=UPI0004053D0C|nr:metallopeptidase TldD-related protein [Propionicicella superfundia]